MTLDEIIKRLEAADIPDAAYEARVLAEHFTCIGAAQLLARRTLPLPNADALEAALCRRERREPLQYIIGEWDFMGLVFKVTPDCLIPRADTELLCETAIEGCPRGGALLDLCTGSGCIAAAVAHYRPDLTVTSLELSDGAATVAEENFRRLTDSRVRLVRADALSAADAERNFHGERFDMIVSNPPYITLKEHALLERELYAEPACALTDGADGLTFYRGITEIYTPYLAPNGTLAFEHGASQGAAVRDIISHAGYCPRTLRDIERRERVTLFTLPN